jgi:hypothetical protein
MGGYEWLSVAGVSSELSFGSVPAGFIAQNSVYGVKASKIICIIDTELSDPSW